MLHVTENEVRDRIAELLDAAERGDEVIIERGEKRSIRLVSVETRLQSNMPNKGLSVAEGLPSLAKFRATMPYSTVSSVDIIRQERDERG